MATLLEAAPRTSIGAAGASSRIHHWIEPNRTAFATADPRTLNDLLFVSSFDEKDPDSPAPKKHGYQRPPDATRFPAIGRYYLEGNNRHLITPLLVSVRLDDPDEIEDFEGLFNEGDVGEIHRRWHKAIVSTIDGQHRKGGIYDGWKQDPSFTPSVPLMLFFGLNYTAEAEMFNIVNSTQRKLPKALIETTKGDITEAGQPTHAQEVRKIAFALAREKDSVWMDQINMTGARDPDRKVTYEGFRRSTANMFPSELLERIKSRNESPVQYAKDYWGLVSKFSYKAWQENDVRQVRDPESGDVMLDPVTSEPVTERIGYRLKELAGVAALSKLGKDIITSALEHEHAGEKMDELISRLREVDWEKRSDNAWMSSGTGFAGQKDLYRVLYALVYMDQRPGETA